MCSIRPYQIYLILLLLTHKKSFACNCTHQVIDCIPYAEFLNKHFKSLENVNFREVRKTTVFAGADCNPITCCLQYQQYVQAQGNAEKQGRIRRNHRPLMFHTDNAWIWDRKPLGEHAITAKFGESVETDFKSNCDVDKHLFDYIDCNTHRNCPHSFYEENYNSNYFHRHQYYDNHHHPHHHNDHHNHYAHHDNHDVFDKEHSHNLYNFKHHFVHDVGDSSAGFNDDDDDNDDYGNGDKKTAIMYPGMHRTVNPSRKFNQSSSGGMKTNILVQNSAKDLINTPDCGISIGSRIIGGIEATIGQYPWITRIAYLNTTSNRISYRCSGSMISPMHLLTAAHCVVNLVSDLMISHVRIGDTDGNNTYEISDIIVHPNYDQPKYANDIAILKIMNTPNDNTASFATICLPVNNSESFTNGLIGATAIVAGWSTNSEGGEINSPTVKFLRLPIVNTTTCAIAYAKYSENFNDPIVITPSQLCAQGEPMNDVCRGDSGGPLMDEGISGLINSNGRHTLLGLVAFGPTTCGVSNFPGVYTRVGAYMKWIENTVIP